MMIRNTYPILLFICSLIQSCGKETQDDTIIVIDTDTTLVDVHGLLVVDGNKIVDKNNEPISLAGNSFFGAMMVGEVKNTIGLKLSNG